MEKKASFTGQGQQMPPHMHQSSAPQPDPPLKELITSLSVTDRPDLMIFRKGSEGGVEGRKLAKMRKKLRDKKDGDDGSVVSKITMPLDVLINNQNFIFLFDIS